MTKAIVSFYFFLPQNDIIIFLSSSKMGLVHIPRTFAAAIKGSIQRYRCPLSEDAKMLE